MQRPTGALGLALLIECVSNRQRVRIEFDYAVDRRTLLVDLGDPGLIFFHQRSRREFARLHAVLQVGNRDFIQFEGLNVWERLGSLRRRRQSAGSAQGGIQSDRSARRDGGSEKSTARGGSLPHQLVFGHEANILRCENRYQQRTYYFICVAQPYPDGLRDDRTACPEAQPKARRLRPGAE